MIRATKQIPSPFDRHFVPPVPIDCEADSFAIQFANDSYHLSTVENSVGLDTFQLASSSQQNNGGFSFRSGCLLCPGKICSPPPPTESIPTRCCVTRHSGSYRPPMRFITDNLRFMSWQTERAGRSFSSRDDNCSFFRAKKNVLPGVKRTMTNTVRSFDRGSETARYSAPMPKKMSSRVSREQRQTPFVRSFVRSIDRGSEKARYSAPVPKICPPGCQENNDKHRSFVRSRFREGS